MNLILYKILTYPLRFTKFFKYGTPYCYLTRIIDEETQKVSFSLIWFFNNDGKKQTSKLKNYSNFKFLGYKKSIYFSYKHLLNKNFKQQKNG